VQLTVSRNQGSLKRSLETLFQAALTLQAYWKPGVRPIDDRLSDASAASVPDGGFAAFDDDRDFSSAAGVLEHLLQLGTIRLNVEVGCFVAIG
jgi:hypothetical protein